MHFPLAQEMGVDQDAVERICGAGQRGEHRRGAGAGVAPGQYGAVITTHHKVQLAVGIQVQEGGRAVDADIEPVERIGGAGEGREDRHGCGAGVAPRQQRAVQIARDEVEQAIAIEIHEGRRSKIPRLNFVVIVVSSVVQRLDTTSAEAHACAVQHIDRKVALDRRRIADIGKGEALDHRIHRRRGDGVVEGHGEVGANAAAGGANGGTAIADGAPRDPDLPAASAQVQDRNPVLRQQPADDQAGTAQRVGADEGHIRIEQLRGCVHLVLEEGDAGCEIRQRHGQRHPISAH